MLFELDTFSSLSSFLPAFLCEGGLIAQGWGASYDERGERLLGSLSLFLSSSLCQRRMVFIEV